MLGQPILGRVRRLQHQEALVHALVHVGDLDVDDLAQVLRLQLAEDDDAVEPVQELRPEVALELFHQLLLHVAVVLFDEIEKAHPETFNLLLQIMEEGHLSDAKGQKVNFRNAIIILTSNVGADMIKKGGGLGFNFKQDAAVLVEENYRDMQKKLMEQLKRHFRPEFLNRLDSFIVFRQLQMEDIRQIVDIQIADVNERMDERFLLLEATDAAKDWLAKHGYDAEYGARPLRRLIQQTVEDKLSDAVLAGEFKDGETVIVDVGPGTGGTGAGGGEIILRHATPEEAGEEPALPGIQAN